jgi:SAM-dependent methyltransferase
LDNMKESTSAITENKDELVVKAFGEEWSRFSQADVPEEELLAMFQDFFAVFPWATVSSKAIGADFGCGSGRWAKFVAPRVGHLHLVDASDMALKVARANLGDAGNVTFHQTSIESVKIENDDLDFAYSLGVLHHLPDTAAAIRAIVAKLKRGSPLLLYLYYSFDNRPVWFRLLWRGANRLRLIVCRLPGRLRFAVCEAIAALVYWPLARIGRVLDSIGSLPDSWPLAWYRNRPFYVMRTDALDRFGTRLEKRFSRIEIERMMMEAGLTKIEFSDRAPFWCVVGWKV